MSSPTYYSAIYIINRSKKVASKMCFPGYTCDFLPEQIKLKELASEFKEISLFVEFINRSKRGLVR